MAIDDHPIEVLRKHLELEDSSKYPLAETMLAIFCSVPLPWPLDAAATKLKDHIAADSGHRIKVMFETCTEELLKQRKQIDQLQDQLTAEEAERRSHQAKELLLDAARKASVTRSLMRVRRIGMILANGVAADGSASEADEVEEMMRVAMDISDRDVEYLRELVRIEGTQVGSRGRMERYQAHMVWEQGFWGARTESEIDSVFSKLESYGLVSRIPPPNNLNLMADFQNRYVLLQKGLHFAELVTAKASLDSLK
jgi:hypothetical protein